MSTHMILFLIAAVVVNVLVYAGMSLVYFNDKRRVDPPKPEPARTPQDASARELQRAA